MLFVWGGVFVGIYTLMMAVVGSRYQGADLIGIYAVMGLTWGVGALLGPALAGLAMDLLPHGLPVFAASPVSPSRSTPPPAAARRSNDTS